MTKLLIYGYYFASTVPVWEQK